LSESAWRLQAEKAAKAENKKSACRTFFDKLILRFDFYQPFPG